MTRIVWFHPRSLLPPRSGGELRVTGLINSVVRAGHEVLVIQPGRLPSAQPDSYRILGVPARQGLDLALAKIFARSPLRTARITPAGKRLAASEIGSFQPDIAVVSDLLSWSVAGGLLPPTPWILDAHNVETDLFREFATQASGLFDRLTFAIDRRRVERQERTVVHTADAVLAVSPDDATRLAYLGTPRRAPVVVPSSVPTPPSARPGVSEPVVLFVGTLDYPPNIKAVEALVSRIIPRVRESVPAARLRVVGRNPTPSVRALLAGLGWAELVEDAPEVATHYTAARCVVLPIEAGGGSRLKVYEALAFGVPIVGTSRALAGVDLTASDVLRADSEDDLVAGAVRVLSDDDLAQRLGAAARQCFVNRLSWDHAAAPLSRLIDELA